MNFKRIGRSLICLILVCVLLVNISPIKAQASGAGVGALLVPAFPVLGQIILGLGIVAGTDLLLYELVDTLTQAGMIDDNGRMEVYDLGDGIIGVSAYFIEALHNWLFDSGAVVDTLHGGYGELATNQRFKYAKASTSYYVNSNCSVFYIYYEYINSQGKVTINNGCLVYSDSTFNVYKDSGVKYSTSTYYSSIGLYSAFVGAAWAYTEGSSDLANYRSQLSGYIDVSHLQTSNHGINNDTVLAWLFDNWDVYASSDDITLGHIAGQGVPLEEGYSDWVDNWVDVGGEPVLPVGTIVADPPADVGTQEDVWTGTAPIIIVIPDTDVGDNPDPPESSEPTEPSDPTPAPIPGDPVTPTLLERLFGNVTDQIENVSISIQEIPDLLREMADDLKKGFLELPGKFAEWFNDIKTKLQEFRSGQITILDILKDLFTPIRNAIVDALTYLFAPSETFISEQVNNLIDKYPSSQNLFALGNQFKSFFLSLGQTPPVIYIDLGNSTGSYLLGGTVAFLDLTWYAQYKPNVDAILGGFLWLWFAWRMWLKLPGILEGTAGEAGRLMTRRESDSDN